MTDRCACSHLWSDHAVSCYSRLCLCNCQPVPVQPATDTALREALRDFVALLPPERWKLLRPETVSTVHRTGGRPMTDRCTCSHPWRDHATSCYYCPCYAHSVAVQPAPDTTLHHHNVPNIGTIWFNAAGKVIGGPEDD